MGNVKRNKDTFGKNTKNNENLRNKLRTTMKDYGQHKDT